MSGSAVVLTSKQRRTLLRFARRFPLGLRTGRFNSEFDAQTRDRLRNRGLIVLDSEWHWQLTSKGRTLVSLLRRDARRRGRLVELRRDSTRFEDTLRTTW